MTQSEIIPNLLDAIPQHININIMTFLPSRLGNQGCFIAVPALGVVRGSQTEQHKNRICVWRNVNCMLETLHQGIGPNEKIKGNCSLYLLHTWMQWRKINTKPPYELSFGWAVDKHWSAVLSAALWERFGRTGLSLLDRCRASWIRRRATLPCVTGISCLFMNPLRNGGKVSPWASHCMSRGKATSKLFTSQCFCSCSPGPCCSSLWFCLQWHHYPLAYPKYL